MANNYIRVDGSKKIIGLFSDANLSQSNESEPLTAPPQLNLPELPTDIPMTDSEFANLAIGQTYENAPITDSQRIDLMQAAIDYLTMGGPTNG